MNRFWPASAFIVETTGGGGIGAPEDRPIVEVLADVAAHRVNPQAAERDYGVVLRRDGTADERATTALRTRRGQK